VDKGLRQPETIESSASNFVSILGLVDKGLRPIKAQPYAKGGLMFQSLV